MRWQPISKSSIDSRVPPNLMDYKETRDGFSWAAIRAELSGLPGGGLNIAHEAVDRQAAGPLQNRVALRWLSQRGDIQDFTYGDLKEQTNRFANVLCGLGIGKGERVFALAGRIPALYVAALGTLKNASVFCPLFSAFGPEPIWQRLHRGDARVLVTTAALYKKKVAAIATCPDRGCGRRCCSRRALAAEINAVCLAGFHCPANQPRGHGAASFH